MNNSFLDDLKEHLLPCDTNAPFVFISYSAIDKPVIWADVVELQKLRYNVWIDEPNLDKTKDSWKDDALSIISNYNCKMLLFYVSRNSLISENCCKELEQTINETTIEQHAGNKVDILVVEAEPIGNIEAFRKKIQGLIAESKSDSEKKGRDASVLYKITTKWLNNNEKVRIVCKTAPGRLGNYIEDLKGQLEKPCLNLKLSDNRIYRNAVNNLMEQRCRLAEYQLKICGKEHVPSKLMLAHIYHTRLIEGSRGTIIASNLWQDACRYLPKEDWGKRGSVLEQEKRYAEALAFLLGYGESLQQRKSLFTAGQLWLKKGCKWQAVNALQQSSAMGSKTAYNFLIQLSSIKDSDIVKNAAKDEVLPE
jgi:RNA binding exosome subunit